ncbi:MAG: RidA family protein [Pseudomonadota bacterium]
MPTQFMNAPDAAQPAPSYAQAALTTDATRWLHISGQIPVTADGAVPKDFRAQADLVWLNIDAQLRAAGMSRQDLVKVTIFLSDRKYIPDYRDSRDAYLQGQKVALTCIVAGIFDEDWLLEIEAVAAN